MGIKLKSLEEVLNEGKMKPSDFKKGDTVKWASAFGSRENDMSGKIIGFKDHEDYKNGYLVIKGKDGKEYKKIFTGVTKAVDEKASWDDAANAINDVMISLQKRNWKVKKNGENSLKVIHDNGVVGVLTFDPQNKF